MQMGATSWRAALVSTAAVKTGLNTHIVSGAEPRVQLRGSEIVF